MQQDILRGIMHSRSNFEAVKCGHSKQYHPTLTDSKHLSSQIPKKIVKYTYLKRMKTPF